MRDTTSSKSARKKTDCNQAGEQVPGFEDNNRLVHIRDRGHAGDADASLSEAQRIEEGDSDDGVGERIQYFATK